VVVLVGVGVAAGDPVAVGVGDAIDRSFKLTVSIAKSAHEPLQLVMLKTAELILAPVWSITPI
jgi:hypothetical protein